MVYLVLEFREKNQTFAKVERCDVDFFRIEPVQLQISELLEKTEYGGED